MGKHLIVMSVDAMVLEDLEYLKDKPYFGRFFKKGSIVKRVRTIYPSLTHAVHVSIMTGCYPDRTGVANNEHFHVGGKGIWYNDLSDVKVPTIFHAAKAAGLSTCACRWPVTSCAGETIDYLVPEIISEIPGESPDKPYLRQGTKENLLREIVMPALQRQDPNAPRHPAYDTHEIECAAEIIRRYQPNLVFCHPGQVDGARHQYGLFNDKVTESLDFAEQYLGMLMDAAEDAGIYDDTDFVVLSDHGQLEAKRTVNLNVLLADAGLIQTDKDGNVTHWDAFVHSAGLSAQVKLQNPDDSALFDTVYQFFLHLRDEGVYGISQVFTAEEAKREYHLAGDFSLVLEGDGYTSFGEDWNHPIARSLEQNDYRYGHGNHGHLPQKGPQPPFLCMGPAFKSGVTLENGKIVDEAPTFARALGITLPGTDGSPMEELLK